MPREPRCASAWMDASKADDDVPGSGTPRRPCAADASPRRNPKGRAAFAARRRRSGLSHWSPMRRALAPWPAAESAPSRPRGILLEAPDPCLCWQGGGTSSQRHWKYHRPAASRPPHSIPPSGKGEGADVSWCWQNGRDKIPDSSCHEEPGQDGWTRRGLSERSCCVGIGRVVFSR